MCGSAAAGRRDREGEGAIRSDCGAVPFGSFEGSGLHDLLLLCVLDSRVRASGALHRARGAPLLADQLQHDELPAAPRARLRRDLLRRDHMRLGQRDEHSLVARQQNPCTSITSHHIYEYIRNDVTERLLCLR